MKNLFDIGVVFYVKKCKKLIFKSSSIFAIYGLVKILNTQQTEN